MMKEARRRPMEATSGCVVVGKTRWSYLVLPVPLISDRGDSEGLPSVEVSLPLPLPFPFPLPRSFPLPLPLGAPIACGKSTS